jgi:hypothetical protein
MPNHHGPSPTDPTGPGMGPPYIDPEVRSCSSKQCVDALAAVAAARGIVTFKCGQVASARSWMNTLAAIAATLFAIAAAAVGAAAAVVSIPVIGQALAVIILWVALTFLATAILFAVLAGIAALRVLVLGGELNGARAAFSNATTGVTNSCPPSCWGDLTMPAC